MFPADKPAIDTSDERKAFDSVDDKKGPKEVEEIDEKPIKEKNDTETPDEDETETTDEIETDDESVDDDETETEDDETTEQLDQDTVYQALKNADKDIFKKIPELKHILFREQKYTELFPTIDDAKEAAERSETFAKYETDLMSGDSSGLLESLEKTDKKALESFVANFIPTLEKQSKDLYLGMIFPEIKKLCRAAAKSGNEILETSAENIHWFVFGDKNLESEQGLKPVKSDEKEDNLSKREREFEQRQYDSFAKDAYQVGQNRLTKIVSFAFKDSDMSPLLQKSLSQEIMSRVDAVIARDPRHMGNINNLWEQARRNGYTSQWKDRIINTYLSRAKLLIPKYRQQVLAEAKVSGKNISDRKHPTRIPSSGSPSTMPKGKVDSKKVDWSKADERAMLDGNVPMKK